MLELILPSVELPPELLGPVGAESAVEDETAIGATQGAERVSCESELQSQECHCFRGGIQAIPLGQPGSDFPAGL